jgi:hypothetical protein
MAPGLLSRIFDHLRMLNLLPEGTTVVDFMGGTGRTAIEAVRRGYRAVTVELEPRFIEFQRLNKTATEKALGRRVDWDIRQGDARRLSEILGVGGAGIVSPPYEGMKIVGGANVPEGGAHQIDRTGSGHRSGYSISPENIGNLKAGIVSPPYGDCLAARGAFASFRGTFSGGRTIADLGPSSQLNNWRYTEKNDHTNIGNLAAVTSPPYMDAQTGGGIAQEGYTTPFRKDKIGGGNKDPVGKRTYMAENHGATVGQLGAQKPESYWEAMRTVYAEAFRCGISPLVVVTKDPTRNRQIVPLGETTCSLLASVGYSIVDYHRAVLFEERRQATLDGDVKKSVAGRVSFFKRLSIAKGSPAARWEDVLFVVKQI